jgi:ribosome biogenesis GTPase A
MSIHWFPGHMHKARKKIIESMPGIDIVIEVLDARIPYSSSNPVIEELRQQKNCIKVLNKSDLADPKITKLWIEHFDKNTNVKSIAMVAEEKKQAQSLIQLIKKIGKHKLSQKKAIRVMIMGIPNVGKSTLINSLSGKYIANTGNEPAVTKNQQMIDLRNGIILSDTPGILWPKIHNQNSAYRLAVTGAIKDTAMEYEDVAMFAINHFKHHYPDFFTRRFKLASCNDEADGLLKQVAMKRGCLRPAGLIDSHKASEIILHEYRSGKIGACSLETPDIMIEEEALRLEQIAKESEKKTPNN